MGRNNNFQIQQHNKIQDSVENKQFNIKHSPTFLFTFLSTTFPFYHPNASYSLSTSIIIHFKEVLKNCSCRHFRPSSILRHTHFFFFGGSHFFFNIQFMIVSYMLTVDKITFIMIMKFPFSSLYNLQQKF